MMPYLHVVCAFHNAAPWLDRCLESVAAQTYARRVCWLLDDASTDDSSHVCRRWSENAADGFVHFRSEERRGQLARYEMLIGQGRRKKLIGKELRDAEIVVLLDGDDWFAHERVLEGVAQRYASRPELGLTWGSYLVHDGNDAAPLVRGDYAQPIPVEDWPRLREGPWRFGHLRTFRAGLWEHIRPADLRDPATGAFWSAAPDNAFMFPLAELAGPDRCLFVPDASYIYNNRNPASEYRSRPADVERCVRAIRAMPPYKRLEELLW